MDLGSAAVEEHRCYRDFRYLLGKGMFSSEVVASALGCHPLAEAYGEEVADGQPPFMASSMAARAGFDKHDD